MDTSRKKPRMELVMSVESQYAAGRSSVGIRAESWAIAVRAARVSPGTQDPLLEYYVNYNNSPICAASPGLQPWDDVRIALGEIGLLFGASLSNNTIL
jgi:hypothetical protein